MQDGREPHFLNFPVAVPPTAVNSKMARILGGVAVNLYSVYLVKAIHRVLGRLSDDNSVSAEKDRL